MSTTTRTPTPLFSLVDRLGSTILDLALLNLLQALTASPLLVFWFLALFAPLTIPPVAVASIAAVCAGLFLFPAITAGISALHARWRTVTGGALVSEYWKALRRDYPLSAAVGAALSAAAIAVIVGMRALTTGWEWAVVPLYVAGASILVITAWAAGFAAHYAINTGHVLARAAVASFASPLSAVLLILGFAVFGVLYWRISLLITLFALATGSMIILLVFERRLLPATADADGRSRPAA